MLTRMYVNSSKIHNFTSIFRAVLLISIFLQLHGSLNQYGIASAVVLEDDEFGMALDEHPDPNDENYPGMIYVGRHHPHIEEEEEKKIDVEKSETVKGGIDPRHSAVVRKLGRRVGFENDDNGITYIFGTSFDESHKEIEEKDLLLHHSRDHTKEQLEEKRHGKVDPKRGPKPYGYVGELMINKNRIIFTSCFSNFIYLYKKCCYTNAQNL